MRRARLDKVIPHFFGKVLADPKDERLQELIRRRLKKRIQMPGRKFAKFLNPNDRRKRPRRGRENPKRTLTVTFQDRVDPLVREIPPVIKLARVFGCLRREQLSADPDTASKGRHLSRIEKEDLDPAGRFEKLSFSDEVLRGKDKRMNASPALFLDHGKGNHFSLEARPSVFLNELGNVMSGKREGLADPEDSDPGHGREKKREKRTPPARKPNQGKKEKRGEENDPPRSGDEFSNQDPRR